MNLIFSEDFDASTDKVIEWLKYLSPESEIDRINGVNPPATISLERKSYSSIWYRRITSINTPGYTSEHRYLIGELKSNHFASISLIQSDNKLGTLYNSIPNKMLMQNKLLKFLV